MSNRFKIITTYNDGTRGVMSFGSYAEASKAYYQQLDLVTWFYDARQVRMIDMKQSQADCEHVLHLCTTSESY